MIYRKDADKECINVVCIYVKCCLWLDVNVWLVTEIRNFKRPHIRPRIRQHLRT